MVTKKQTKSIYAPPSIKTIDFVNVIVTSTVMQSETGIKCPDGWAETWEE